MQFHSFYTFLMKPDDVFMNRMKIRMQRTERNDLFRISRGNTRIDDLDLPRFRRDRERDRVPYTVPFHRGAEFGERTAGMVMHAGSRFPQSGNRFFSKTVRKNMSMEIDHVHAWSVRIL